MFGREKRQEERIDRLERQVFLLQAQLDQVRAEIAPKKPAAKKATPATKK